MCAKLAFLGLFSFFIFKLAIYLPFEFSINSNLVDTVAAGSNLNQQHAIEILGRTLSSLCGSRTCVAIFDSLEIVAQDSSLAALGISCGPLWHLLWLQGCRQRSCVSIDSQSLDMMRCCSVLSRRPFEFALLPRPRPSVQSA